MSKDYAKAIYTNKRKRMRDEPQGNFLWVIVLLILLGVSAGTYYEYAHHRESFLAWADKIKAVLKHQNASTSKKPDAPVATVKQDQDVRFDFYTELPSMKVASLVNTSQATAAAVNKPLTKPISAAAIDKTKAVALKKYFLLLGTFKTEAEASQYRLSLLLSGFEAEMVKTTNAYQVQQGPFATMTQAQSSLHRLEKKGLSGTVQKID